MKKTLKSTIILVYLCLTLLFFILNSQKIIKEVLEYSKIFIINIFPSTFIFYIMTNLIIEYGIIEITYKYLHIKSIKVHLLLLSFLSGFPNGVKNTKELYIKNIIDLENANKYIMFTHFPNIIFVLGTCMKIINNKQLTYYILISLIISNIIVSLFCKENKSNIVINNNSNNDFSKILSISIKNTFNIIMLIYGVNLLFYLISSVITKPFVNNIYIYVLLNGLLDLTKGISNLYIINSEMLRAIYILLFLSLGSISIHIQTKSILSDTSINYKYYLKGRLLCTCISLFIFLILTK